MARVFPGVGSDGLCRSMHCPACGSDLLAHHILEDPDVPPMTNGSRIIHPACASCGRPIRFEDVSGNMDAARRVLLITGTAGAGKTAIGQLIERRSDFVFIDGDAIQKRVNAQARRDPAFLVDSQTATIDAMRIVLALGYDVVVGYILGRETWRTYSAALAEFGITPVFRVLVPDRDVCLERDLARECWTAGPVWVDRWYEEMRSYLNTHAQFCIDSSRETLEETFQRHFEALLSERNL